MHKRILTPAARQWSYLWDRDGPAAALADASPLFKKLAGVAGAGDLVLEDGTRERLSCRGITS